MDWVSIKNQPPAKNGVYWCFPTSHSRKYCALYWDGKCFSSGSYFPEGITHYQEMSLHYPEPPNELDSFL
jgi:hypothetical protein